MVRLYRDGVPVTALWCETKCAEKPGDWPETERLCRELLAILPSSWGAQELLTWALMAQERFAEAAQEFQPLIENSQNPKSLLWAHMAAACAAGDWAAVRHSAQMLDFKLDSEEGPVEENWGWVIICYQEEG